MPGDSKYFGIWNVVGQREWIKEGYECTERTDSLLDWNDVDLQVLLTLSSSICWKVDDV